MLCNYDSIGNSQIYGAAYLHKLVLGRCDEDNQSQLYFGEKTLKIQPSDFVDVVTSLCEGWAALELLESGVDDVKF